MSTAEPLFCLKRQLADACLLHPSALPAAPRRQVRLVVDAALVSSGGAGGSLGIGMLSEWARGAGRERLSLMGPAASCPGLLRLAEQRRPAGGRHTRLSEPTTVYWNATPTMQRTLPP